MKAVAYFRVSTASQGRSGLGLEAQRQAVDALAVSRGLTLLSTFTEIESGKRNDRPQLKAALQLAKLTGATLVIAKLDRLSRNAAFLLALRDSGARFLAADIPDANDLTIGLLAVIAQAEREAISRRTKEALAAVRLRIHEHGSHKSARSGLVISRLGNPNGSRALLAAGRGNGSAVEAGRRSAFQRAQDLAPLLRQLIADGMSLSAIARDLNGKGVLTPRGRMWHPSSVKNLMDRAGIRRKIDGHLAGGEMAPKI